MVAGGLAFTIPGIFILNNDAEFSILKVMLVTVGGTVLGLIFTSLIRKHFVVEADMPYAMGQAAAEVVVVGDEGGKQTGALFGSLGDRRSLDRPAGLVCRRPRHDQLWLHAEIWFHGRYLVVSHDDRRRLPDRAGHHLCLVPGRGDRCSAS